LPQNKKTRRSNGGGAKARGGKNQRNVENPKKLQILNR